MSIEMEIRERLRCIDAARGSRFLEMGRKLREFYDGISDHGCKLTSLETLVDGTGISRRMAMHWIVIDRVYSQFRIEEARLGRVGWSKLAMIAKFVNATNIEDWLSFAERSSTSELRARIRKTPTQLHHVVFQLTAKQHSILKSALLEHGARALSRRRLGNKEAALIELCRHHLRLTAGKNEQDPIHVEAGSAHDEMEAVRLI